jgi:hypothetical protein
VGGLVVAVVVLARTIVTRPKAMCGRGGSPSTGPWSLATSSVRLMPSPRLPFQGPATPRSQKETSGCQRAMGLIDHPNLRDAYCTTGHSDIYTPRQQQVTRSLPQSLA